MRGKFAFVVGAAVGYVLGSRAGRERYEQIRRGAKKVWNTTPVQHGVHVVKDAVDERTDDLKLIARRVGSQLLSKMAEQTAGKPDDSKATTESSSQPQAPTPAARKSGKPAAGKKDPSS